MTGETSAAANEGGDKTVVDAGSKPPDNDRTCESKKSGGDRSNRIRKIWSKILLLPYFIGIVWTCLHPRFSVLTGENKCRGSYIDENALDAHFASIRSYNSNAPTSMGQESAKNSWKKVARLCDHFGNNRDETILCHRHGDLFDIAAITPVSNAIEPHEEAIVLVVSGTDDWIVSRFHSTLIHWYRRLADPIEIPWLAKTVYVVAPPSPTMTEKHDTSSLEDTVSHFLDAYLGSKGNLSLTPMLPPHISGAMLRNLIVLDVDTTDLTILNGNMRREDKVSTFSHVSVLPQGRRGTLPNMDLVFIIGQLFNRATFTNTRIYPKSTFTVHPYVAQTQIFQKYLDGMTAKPRETTSLQYQLRYWAEDMANLCLFAYTMALGPFPPHSPALDRGIDSITIQAGFHGKFSTRGLGGGDPVSDLFQLIEYLIRALSNLHERLHHSITLYLLPSPRTFVSHVEYLLPNLLVLLPLAIRALGILIWDMKTIHLSSAGHMLFFATFSMAFLNVVAAVPDLSMLSFNVLIISWYVLVGIFWYLRLKGYEKGNGNDFCRTMNSMHFVVCLTAIFVHVPIAFAHVSLAYPSSMLWTMVLAFPRFGDSTNTKVLNWIGLIVLVITAPPLFLVPAVFETYTAYLRTAYIPLHIQFWIILLTRFTY